MSESAHHGDKINIHITFAAATEPFHHKYAATSTVASVLQDALAFFAIHADGATRYFLISDGSELDPNTAIGAIAEAGHGHSHSVKLSLRTETISGTR